MVFLVLFLLGGAISYLGNQLGRAIGRRKLSIFGLRPRHTSMVITMFTGALIAALTLGGAALMSREVQQFLNGMHDLKAEMAQLVQAARSYEVVFKIHQPIAAASIQGGEPVERIKPQLDNLLVSANEAIVQQNNLLAAARKEKLLSQDQKLVAYLKPEYNELAQKLAGSKGRVVVFATAAENIFPKETVPVRFTVEPDARIFAAGEEIARAQLDGRKPRDQVRQDLLDFIGPPIRAAALRRGMIPNLLTGRIDSDLTVGAVEKAVDEITAVGMAHVEAVANKEIDSLGPLDVRLVVGQVR